MLDYRLFYSRNLPHYQPANTALFVTFRLAGSIPVSTLRQLHEEFSSLLATAQGLSSQRERNERIYLEQKRTFGRLDALLDAGETGPHWLREPAIAQLVADALHYRHDKVYRLDTFCLMPNHVHVVYTPLQKSDGVWQAMSAIMHSLKRHTAREANQLLNRTGAFWHHESYDHAVRDADEHQRIIAYVLNNPVKAKLVADWRDWPWSYTQHSV